MRGVPTLKPLPTLYPEAQPARSGRLAVTGGHELQWFEWGRPEGTPALLLHGGPGSGLSAFQARFFDPQRLRVIGFDLDMTLVDSADAIVDSVLHTAAVFGGTADDAVAAVINFIK